MADAAKQLAPAVPAPDESAALISMIERAARDQSVDIDKMERLFQMHERASQRRAEGAFNAAMAAAQADIAPVARNKENRHTQSRYADLFAIADKALPIAHRHGFGLSFSEFKSDVPNCLGVECEVTHAAGFSKRYRFNVPVDKAGSQGRVNKTDTQAYGSTFTYGRRYATCGVFNIAVKDMDGNQPPASSETITEAQQDELRALIAETNSDLAKFLAIGGVEDLSDILASQFGAAKAKLLAKKKKASPQ